jgi:hypothetical protein
MTGFLIPVDAGGYRWAKGEAIGPDLRPGKKGRYLVGQSAAIPGNHLVRPYDPMEDPALFRHFGDLERTEDPVSHFAGQYGLLGALPIVKVAIPKENVPNEDAVSPGETLDEWRAAIHEMSETITIWDWVCARDVESLGKHIAWSDGPDGSSVSYYRDPITGKGERSIKGGYSLIAHVGLGHADLIASFARDDLIAPAAALVRGRVDTQLKRGVHAHLLQTNNEVRFSLGVKPTGLLAALWLQFAQAIESDLRFRRCDHCGKWFRYEPGRGRYPRQYCTQAHKVASHRLAKKVEALVATGSKRNEIADQLGVSVDRVRALEAR